MLFEYLSKSSQHLDIARHLCFRSKILEHDFEFFNPFENLELIHVAHNNSILDAGSYGLVLCEVFEHDFNCLGVQLDLVESE